MDFASIYEFFQEGGGVFMVPIILASIVALTIILERCVFWVNEFFSRDIWLRRQLLQNQGKLDDELETRDVVAKTIYHYRKYNLEMARHTAKNGILGTRRYLGTLRLVANLATSLGLLGTVVGVSISFKSMAMTDSAGVARGLSTALYTTIAGLIVFLIASVALHIFQSLSQKVTKDLEDSLIKLHYGKKSSSRLTKGQPYSPPHIESQPALLMDAHEVQASVQQQVQERNAQVAQPRRATPTLQPTATPQPAPSSQPTSSGVGDPGLSPSDLAASHSQFSSVPQVEPDQGASPKRKKKSSAKFSAVPRIAPDSDDSPPLAKKKERDKRSTKSLSLAAQLAQLEGSSDPDEEGEKKKTRLA